MAELCAPSVEPDTLRRIAAVESSFNPYAIGVVGGRLQRQPRNGAEAVATTGMLSANGWDYSVGLVQVNQKNFSKYGLTPTTAFNPCENLRAGSQILVDCYRRAGGSATPLGDALSCYYSGNFSAGYRLGYVAKVLGGPQRPPIAGIVQPIPVVATAPTPRSRKPQVVHQAQTPLLARGFFLSAPDALAGGGGSSTSAAGSTALLF